MSDAMIIAVAPTSMINLECQFLSYFLCYEYHSSALFTLILYIEIQPNAFATELNNIITAKIGHKYLIITINIFLWNMIRLQCKDLSLYILLLCRYSNIRILFHCFPPVLSFSIIQYT